MLDQKGFDLWAEGYDRSGELSDEEARFPFAGYKALLNEIYNRVLAGPHRTVLDIGFGTAFLTSPALSGGRPDFRPGLFGGDGPPGPGKDAGSTALSGRFCPGGCGPS